MMATRVMGTGLLALLSLAGCHEKTPSEPGEGAASAASAATSGPAAAVASGAIKAPASTAPSAPATAAGLQPGQVGPLPPSDRVFALSLDGQPRDHLLGTDGDALWAVEPTARGEGKLLWRVTGPGVVQKVVVGDLGKGRRLFVARGVGRGFLRAPLVLQSLDPLTGQAEELWRFAGERAECAHLSLDDVDGDGETELAFAYYASKYMVRTRHLDRDGQPLLGPEVRMATSRAYGDLNGDGKLDEAVGRVYGDAKGDPGDLKVDLGQGPVKVPTEDGVRAVMVAKLAGDAGPTLYFADGWVADYGKSAKAQLKRARWDGKGFAVEPLVRSPSEFTFFHLETAALGDAGTVVVAQGNKQVSAILPGPKAPWALKPLAQLEPVLNTALGRTGPGAWAVYTPAKPHTRAVPVTLP